MSTVRKSALYYCRAFISINGRQINYKYIIATNSFMGVITIFRLYNMEDCDNTHETISSYNVFAVYSSTIY